MAPEPVSVGEAPLEVKQEDAILRAHSGFALAFFVVCCVWLLVVTVLLFLSGVSVAHVSDSVLIAAIVTIPALFAIFRFLFPTAPTRPHFANFERAPKTGEYRMLV